MKIPKFIKENKEMGVKITENLTLANIKELFGGEDVTVTIIFKGNDITICSE